MILMKRAAAASAALILMLLAVLTTPVNAYSNQAVVTIPVTTVWSQFSDRPYKEDSFVSAFVLTPLDGAPAPETGAISIKGAGKGELGPIVYNLPGDYYYRLDGSVNNKKETVSMTIRVTIINGEDGLASIVTAYDSSEDALEGVEKNDLVFELYYKKGCPSCDPPTKPDKPNGGDQNTGKPSTDGKTPNIQKPDTNGGTSTNNNTTTSTITQITTKSDTSTTTQAISSKPVNTASATHMSLWLLLAVAAIILAAGFHRLSAKK